MSLVVFFHFFFTFFDFVLRSSGSVFTTTFSFFGGIWKDGLQRQLEDIATQGAEEYFGTISMKTYASGPEAV
jgi:hypothetical protein